MIRGFIQLALGTIGRAVLAFYRTYSLPLSTIVVAYGVVTLYAHSNLRTVIRRIESMMLEIARAMGDRPDHRQVHRQLAKRWKAEQSNVRLFLPSRGDFWFGFVDRSELIEALHLGPDYVRLALHKHTDWPERKDFHPVDYGAWEEYRHRLLIGVRVKLPDIRALKAEYRERQKKRAREGSKRKK
jgi:hypothetical protein